MGIRIAIATHRRVQLLARTLQSLVDARKPPEFECVVVVENGDACGAREVCREFEPRLPIEYEHVPSPGKGRALQRMVDQARQGFVLFLDDDVRVSEELIECYALAIRTHGPGHFFGGPILPEYEREPAEWLKDYLPCSAKGWRPQNPDLGLSGSDRFLGANFGAYVDDVRAVGGFAPQFGPGALVEGTENNPTGLETELQDRLLRHGCAPVYVQAAVWHYVPTDRCSASWALHRAFRDALSRGLRQQGQRGSQEGPRRWRVPRRIWTRYVRAAYGLVTSTNPFDRRARFRWRLLSHEFRGEMAGYRTKVRQPAREV